MGMVLFRHTHTPALPSERPSHPCHEDEALPPKTMSHLLKMVFIGEVLARGDDRHRFSQSRSTLATTFQRRDADKRHAILRYDQRTACVGWLPGTIVEIFLRRQFHFSFFILSVRP